MRFTVHLKREGNIYNGKYSIDGITTHFSRQSMKDIIRAIHLQAKQHENLKLFWDNGVGVVQVEDNLVELIRTDPVTAIRVFDSLSNVVVDTRSPGRKPEVEVEQSLIRSCFDTLADSFGDVVYIRYCKPLTENPFSSSWVNLEELNSLFGGCLDLVPVADEWVALDTEKLLDWARKSSIHRLFLPREWNPNNTGWISITELEVLFNSYRKDKKQCMEVQKA